jgi:hypothetical protein
VFIYAKRNRFQTAPALLGNGQISFFSSSQKKKERKKKKKKQNKNGGGEPSPLGVKSYKTECPLSIIQ